MTPSRRPAWVITAVAVPLAAFEAWRAGHGYQRAPWLFLALVLTVAWLWWRQLRAEDRARPEPWL